MWIAPGSFFHLAGGVSALQAAHVDQRRYRVDMGRICLDWMCNYLLSSPLQPRKTAMFLRGIDDFVHHVHITCQLVNL